MNPMHRTTCRLVLVVGAFSSNSVVFARLSNTKATEKITEKIIEIIPATVNIATMESMPSPQRLIFLYHKITFNRAAARTSLKLGGC